MAIFTETVINFLIFFFISSQSKKFYSALSLLSLAHLVSETGICHQLASTCSYNCVCDYLQGLIRCMCKLLWDLITHLSLVWLQLFRLEINWYSQSEEISSFNDNWAQEECSQSNSARSENTVRHVDPFLCEDH